MEGKMNLKQIETPKYDKHPHSFLLRKLSSSTSNKNVIKSEIAEFFNSPDKFFNPNSNIVINRKINLKKIIHIEENKPSANKTIGRRDSFRSSKNNTSKLSYLKEKNSIYNKFSPDDKDDHSPGKNFEVIDKERLRSIFISFKKASQNILRKNKDTSINEEKNNSNNSKNDFEKQDKNGENIPKQLSLDLGIQNRRLLTKKNLDKKSHETSRYLSLKLHKNENDLLFNSVHLYRFKKEILGKEDTKEFDKVNNQSCLFKWTSSLRRPKNFYGKRESYINVGGENNPLWSIVVEKYPITKEVVVQSGYNLDNKDFRDFIRKRNNDSKSNEKIKKVEDLDEIGINGKSLYDLEYNREMSGNKRKILHNVFVENGKAILYRDINKIYGHETIYKNYSGRNSLRKNKLGLYKANQSANIINKISLKDWK